MRPLTDKRPKPMIEVLGRSMLDRVLDHLVAAGVTDCVVNTHYLGEMIQRALKSRMKPRITISHEETLFDTGGGVARALPQLGADPFFVVNADVVWLDGRRSALARLAQAWDGEKMDACLMVHSTVRAIGYDGTGDFTVDPLGLVHRRRESHIAPFVFTGVQMLHPRLFAAAPDGAFSLNRLYDRAEEAGRLFAIVHDGEWFHIGTPDSLVEAETAMRDAFRVDPRRDP
jgi:MurNAc alpha-1-phosphate uridylyltransferase